MPPTIIFIIKFPGGLFVTEGDPDNVYNRLAAGEDVVGYRVNYEPPADQARGPVRLDPVHQTEPPGYVLRVGPGFVLIYVPATSRD